MEKEERIDSIKVFNIEGKRLNGVAEINLTKYSDVGMPRATTKVQLPQWLCAEIYNLVYAEYESNCGGDKCSS